MADVILFRPNEKIVKGGNAINKRTGAPIGRPRTRAPRQPRVVPVWLDAGEIRQLQAKPIAALPPSEAEQAIPPFQRLSLAKQIEITYTDQRRQQEAKRQRKSKRAAIDKRDRLVHTEQVLNWRVEIWQKGETRGTDKPLYFYRTESLTAGAVGGCKGKGRFEYVTPERCLNAARYKVRERETQWRQCGRPVSRERRYYKFRRYARPVSLPPQAAALDQPPSVMELIGDVALCPVCRQLIDRNRYALSDHFERHVCKGLLKSREVDELLSFLVAPRHERRTAYA